MCYLLLLVVYYTKIEYLKVFSKIYGVDCQYWYIIGVESSKHSTLPKRGEISGDIMVHSLSSNRINTCKTILGIAYIFLLNRT